MRLEAYVAKNIRNAAMMVIEMQSSVAQGCRETIAAAGFVQVELGSNMDSLVKDSYKVQEAIKKIAGVKDVKSSYT